MGKVGTTADVIAAFIDGHDLRTTSAPVPGGRRVESSGGTLYSYRTAVAVREPDGHPGGIAVTLRRYSVTTSKLTGHVRGALARRGYTPSALTTFGAAVPGRWGGYGPAWHPTGYETVPAEVWS